MGGLKTRLVDRSFAVASPQVLLSDSLCLIDNYTRCRHVCLTDATVHSDLFLGTDYKF